MLRWGEEFLTKFLPLGAVNGEQCNDIYGEHAA